MNKEKNIIYNIIYNNIQMKKLIIYEIYIYIFTFTFNYPLYNHFINIM